MMIDVDPSKQMHILVVTYIIYFQAKDLMKSNWSTRF